MAGLRAGLLTEIVVMSVDTLRTSKMRSALTVLGVVIGITSIVGMTSLIRGFDQSFRDAITQLGPDTIMVQKWGALSFSAGNFAKVEAGRVFTPTENEHRRPVVLLGYNPWQALFPNVDPIGKTVRIGSAQFTVIGVLGKRPSPGNFSTGADDFALIPYGAHEKMFGRVLKGSAKISAGSFNPAVFRTAMIAIVPREGQREAAMREV